MIYNVKNFEIFGKIGTEIISISPTLKLTRTFSKIEQNKKNSYAGILQEEYQYKKSPTEPHHLILIKSIKFPIISAEPVIEGV